MPTFRKDIKTGTKVPLIKTDDLNDKLITADKLADGSVTNSKLAPESVTQDKFDKQLLEIFQAAAGLPKDIIETIQDVDDTLKGHQSQISSNDEDISALQSQTKQIKDTVDGIAISGGASIASAVSYDNTTSGLEAMNLQNAIDELVNNLGHYETNEEWIRLYLDAEGHILWGIKADGSIEWSVGIPTPIQKKLNELISSDDTIKQTIAELREYTDQQLATKVDKEEGKSLISDDVKDCFKIVENEEFVHCIVDAEEHILFAIRRDTGKPYFPLNEMYHVEQNEEFCALWKDSADHILMGIRRDGVIVGEINACNELKKVIASIQSDVQELQSIEPSLKELLDTFSFQENEEFLAVEKDAAGHILAYTNADGSHYIHNVKSETIPEEFSHTNDPEERLAITIDSKGKVISFRDKEGTLHEHSITTENLYTNRIKIANKNEFVQDLVSNGFNGRFCDFTLAKNIQIPIPKCAYINVINNGNAVIPTSKTDNFHYYVQFYDMHGNYFEKRVTVNAQGNSSLGDPKKNIALDFCNDEWLGDDTFKIKFGEWVAQDSFHLKAYYSDTFVGIPVVGYMLYNEIVKSRGISDDRTWKRALLNSEPGILPSVLASESIEKRLDTGARCFPDGFPCIVYIEGEFYGIFAFQLKKHRDNFMMDKNMATHVHIDGAISDALFAANGSIDWDIFNGKKAHSNGLKEGIEIRNPKSLIGMNGSKYDFDTNPVELIDATSEKYDENNKNMKRSQDVKNILIELSKHVPEIDSLIDSSAERTAIRNMISKYFDVESLIDYILFSDLVANWDGVFKNWQWTTYDGIKWSVNPYDLDMTFGLKGGEESEPTKDYLNYSVKNPYGLVARYFSGDLAYRYKQLRKNKIIDVEHITALLTTWQLQVGIDNYKKEEQKWSGKRKDNIYRFHNWIAKAISLYDTKYEYSEM